VIEDKYFDVMIALLFCHEPASMLGASGGLGVPI